MTGNKIQYTLDFKANLTDVKGQLNRLKTHLSSVAGMPFALGTRMNQDLQLASQAAIQLQGHLSKAMNPTTGRLDLGRFSSSIKSANADLSVLSTNLLKSGATGEAAFLSMSNAIINAQSHIFTTNKMLSSLWANLKNVAKWQISSYILTGMISSFQGLVQYAEDLNKTLTDIRIVTGASKSEMRDFAIEANRAAKALGTTTNEFAQAALIYRQQGDSAAEAMRKAEITVKMANVSFSSNAQEMSEYLTSIWNSYHAAGNELELYADKLAKVGAITATSSEEMATSMQKVAAAAYSTGVEYDQLLGVISTVSSATRESAEVTGTAFKTIFARMTDLKIEGSVEDGDMSTTLGQISSSLDAIGIKIYDVNGQVRDTGAILTDLGDRWKDIDDNTRSAIAQSVAGKRQYTQLLALFDNWDKYRVTMSQISDTQGELNKQQAMYLEGIDGAKQKLAANKDALKAQLIDDEMIIGVVDAFADFINIIETVLDTIGGLGPILLYIGGVALNKFAPQIASAAVSVRGSITSAFGVIVKRITGVDPVVQGFISRWQQLAQQLNSQGLFSSSSKIELNYLFKMSQIQEQLSTQMQNMTETKRQQLQLELDTLKLENEKIMSLAREEETRKRIAVEAQKAHMVNEAASRQSFREDPDAVRSRVSAKLQDTSKISIGMSEDELNAGVDLPKGQTASQLGIDVKNFSMSLDEVANKWQAFNEIGQSTVLEKFATQLGLPQEEIHSLILLLQQLQEAMYMTETTSEKVDFNMDSFTRSKGLVTTDLDGNVVDGTPSKTKSLNEARKIGTEEEKRKALYDQAKTLDGQEDLEDGEQARVNKYITAYEQWEQAIREVADAKRQLSEIENPKGDLESGMAGPLREKLGLSRKGPVSKTDAAKAIRSMTQEDFDKEFSEKSLYTKKGMSKDEINNINNKKAFMKEMGGYEGTDVKGLAKAFNDAVGPSGQVSQNIQKLNTDISNSTNQSKKLETQMDDIAKISKKTKLSLFPPGQNFEEKVQSLSSISGAAMQCASAFSMVSSSFESLFGNSDEPLTTGERITQIMTLMSGVLMGVVGALQLYSTMMNLKIAADTAGAASSKALGIAIQNIPLIGWILAIISALITLMSVIDSWARSNTAAVESAKKYEKAMKAVEEAEKEVAKHQENIDFYSDLSEKIKDTQGNMMELAKVTNEVNKALGTNFGLLVEGTDAYNRANAAIEQKIQMEKYLKESAKKDVLEGTDTALNNLTLESDDQDKVEMSKVLKALKGKSTAVVESYLNGQTLTVDTEGYLMEEDILSADLVAAFDARAESLRKKYAPVIEDNYLMNSVFEEAIKAKYAQDQTSIQNIMSGLNTYEIQEATAKAYSGNKKDVENLRQLYKDALSGIENEDLKTAINNYLEANVKAIAAATKGIDATGASADSAAKTIKSLGGAALEAGKEIIKAFGEGRMPTFDERNSFVSGLKEAIKPIYTDKKTGELDNEKFNSALTTITDIVYSEEFNGENTVKLLGELFTKLSSSETVDLSTGASQHALMLMLEQAGVANTQETFNYLKDVNSVNNKFANVGNSADDLANAFDELKKSTTLTTNELILATLNKKIWENDDVGWGSKLVQTKKFLEHEKVNATDSAAYQILMTDVGLQYGDASRVNWKDLNDIFVDSGIDFTKAENQNFETFAKVYRPLYEQSYYEERKLELSAMSRQERDEATKEYQKEMKEAQKDLIETNLEFIESLDEWFDTNALEQYIAALEKMDMLLTLIEDDLASIDFEKNMMQGLESSSEIFDRMTRTGQLVDKTIEETKSHLQYLLDNPPEDAEKYQEYASQVEDTYKKLTDAQLKQKEYSQAAIFSAAFDNETEKLKAQFEYSKGQYEIIKEIANMAREDVLFSQTKQKISAMQLLLNSRIKSTESEAVKEKKKENKEIVKEEKKLREDMSEIKQKALEKDHDAAQKERDEELQEIKDDHDEALKDATIKMKELTEEYNKTIATINGKYTSMITEIDLYMTDVTNKWVENILKVANTAEGIDLGGAPPVSESRRLNRGFADEISYLTGTRDDSGFGVYKFDVANGSTLYAPDYFGDNADMEIKRIDGTDSYRFTAVDKDRNPIPNKPTYTLHSGGNNITPGFYQAGEAIGEANGSGEADTFWWTKTNAGADKPSEWFNPWIHSTLGGSWDREKTKQTKDTVSQALLFGSNRVNANGNLDLGLTKENAKDINAASDGNFIQGQDGIESPIHATVANFGTGNSDIGGYYDLNNSNLHIDIYESKATSEDLTKLTELEDPPVLTAPEDGVVSITDKKGLLFKGKKYTFEIWYDGGDLAAGTQSTGAVARGTPLEHINSFWDASKFRIRWYAGNDTWFDGFAKGTGSAPGGVALVGEEGKELVINPDGTCYMVGENGAEFVNLQRGAQVIPNEETEEILDRSTNSLGNNEKVPAYEEGTTSLPTQGDNQTNHGLVERNDLSRNLKSSKNEFLGDNRDLLKQQKDMEKSLFEEIKFIQENIVAEHLKANDAIEADDVATNDAKVIDANTTYIEIITKIQEHINNLKTLIEGTTYSVKEPDFANFNLAVDAAITKWGNFKQELGTLEHLEPIKWEDLEKRLNDFLNKEEERNEEKYGAGGGNLAPVDVSQYLKSKHLISDGNDNGIGYITSEFGMRWHPTDQKWANHTGIDIGVNNKDDTYFAHSLVDGRVLRIIPTKNSGGYGNRVEILGEDGLVYSYSHLSRFSDTISEGQTITSGTIVGKVGNTGKSTGPHLHFEVQSGNSYINPLEVLKNYATGTNGLKTAEDAIVGELGPELAIFADGSVKMLGVDGVEYAHLPAGTRIFSNEQTRDLLKTPKNYADGNSATANGAIPVTVENPEDIAEEISTKEQSDKNVEEAKNLKQTAEGNEEENSNKSTELAEKQYQFVTDNKNDVEALKALEFIRSRADIKEKDGVETYTFRQFKTPNIGKAYHDLLNFQMAGWDPSNLQDVITNQKLTMKFMQDEFVDFENLGEQVDEFYQSLEIAYKQGMINEEAYQAGLKTVKDFYEQKNEQLEKITETMKTILQSPLDRYELYLKELEKRYTHENNILKSLENAYNKRFTALNKLADIEKDINNQLRDSMLTTQWLTEETRKMVFNEKNHYELSKAIKENRETINKATYEYYTKISQLGEDEWYLEKKITEEYNQQVASAERKLQILQAEVGLEQKRNALTQALQEKNVRVFTGGRWQQMSNFNDVRAAAQDYESQMYEIQKAVREDYQAEQIDKLKTQQVINDEIVAENNQRLKNLKDSMDKMFSVVGNLDEFTIPDLISAMGTMEESFRMSQNIVRDAQDKEGKDLKILINEQDLETRKKTEGLLNQIALAKIKHSLTDDEEIKDKAHQEAEKARAELYEIYGNKGQHLYGEDTSLKELAENINNLGVKYDIDSAESLTRAFSEKLDFSLFAPADAILSYDEDKLKNIFDAVLNITKKLNNPEISDEARVKYKERLDRTYKKMEEEYDSHLPAIIKLLSEEQLEKLHGVIYRDSYLHKLDENGETIGLNDFAESLWLTPESVESFIKQVSGQEEEIKNAYKSIIVEGLKDSISSLDSINSIAESMVNVENLTIEVADTAETGYTFAQNLASRLKNASKNKIK